MIRRAAPPNGVEAMTAGETQALERLGPYRLIRKIGEGGMGVVYLALDERGRQLAVKVLHPHVAADLKARDRLVREVETMRRVRSPYVAEVVDAQLMGPQPYVVTRFAPGRTLEDTVLEDGPLAGHDLLRVIRGMCAALVAIHAADVIHRDFKPSNVMLVDGEPLVIDFGIAHLVNATRLTQTGMFVGTPGYLAPEIIRDAEITQAADVHALASTVFFAATGKPPFGTGAFEAICFNIMEGRVQYDLAPAWLRAWLRAAMAVDAQARPNAQELYRMALDLDPDRPSVSPVAETKMNGVPPTRVLDGDAGQAAPAAPVDGTRVLPVDDTFSDLLPPVEYAPVEPTRRQAPPPPAPPPAPPPQYVPPHRPPPWPDQHVAGYGPPPVPEVRPSAPPPPAPERQRERRPPYRVGHPVLAALMLVVLVSLACMLPVAVSAFAVVAVLCLRVGEHLFSDLAERRRVRGSSGADPLLAVLGTPWALIKSAVGTVVHVPLAVMFGMCLWGVLAYGTSMGTDRAAAYAAGAFTAGLFVLPGGSKPRRAVSRALTATVRSPGAAMVAAIILGTAAFFLGMTALGTTPVFDPWQPPSEVIDQITTEFRRRTDEVSIGAIDLLSGLVGSLLDSLGLGFLHFWS
ncbi:Serine/threonine protein kinase [Thermostaphylospora chromogena]|uniref:Serine/threonine protein kinase n=2 Tax=Thermostaphylospora chromogena TaxID=35622 RepID=A0A1H1AI96_9ACTN|nr:Serine/threonine protein kinase [Thermostaphylospora chromogena]